MLLRYDVSFGFITEQVAGTAPEKWTKSERFKVIV